MTKALKILRCNRGEGYPLVIAVTLALLIIFCGIAEYFRLNIIVQGVRDAAQQAVISVMSDNYNDVYHSTREGYAAGWYPSAEDWEESLDLGDVYSQLTNTLALTYSGGEYIKLSGEQKEFALHDLEVEIRNNALSSGEAEGYLADVTLNMDVPTQFCGTVLPDLHLTLKTQAKYIPKF
ncbi:MAG: hypothetical protein RSG53_10385 [Oscillospiraceae bacterium]